MLCLVAGRYLHMTRLITILLFAVSAFGQLGNDYWKQALDLSTRKGETALQAIETQDLPAYNKSAQELSEAIDTGKSPSVVAEIEKRFSDSEFKLHQTASEAWLALQEIPGAAERSLRDGYITQSQFDKSVVLVEKLKKYESYHGYEPEDPQLYAKVFEYATNSARQLLKDVDQAVKNRGNTVKDLEKQVGKDDKVKTKAYANRLESAHKEVARLMDESRAVWRLLLSFNFEFEQGRLAEKKYDESKRLQSKIDEQTKRRWLPKEALSLYERASGESSVSLVMQ